VIRLPQAADWRRLARWLLVLLAAWVVFWLFSRAATALTPFIFGLVLAYLFLPLVNGFDQRMPRWAAILIVYVMTFGVMVAAISVLIPQLIEQISELIRAFPPISAIQAEAQQLFTRYEQLLTRLPPAVQGEVRAAVDSAVVEGLSTLRSNLVTYLTNVGRFVVDSVLSVVNTVTFLLGFLLVPFWLFYVLMDQRAAHRIIDRMLHPRIRLDFWSLLTILDFDLSGYLRGQLLLGASVGIAAGFGLTVLSLFGLEVPYILLLSVLAAITELVPVIGPIVGAIPAIILGFMDSPTTGIAVLVLYILIQQLENNILVPRIVGESVGLPPAVLMVLLVACSQVFGLLGAILSAPLGAMARDVFIYLHGRLSEPPLPAGLLPQRLRKAALLLPADPGEPAEPSS
jgi:predicted PurR-regulated permease PerM